ncbi:hypothetical protein MASR1M45_07120 [Candidatus Kapaibacterium sp.]
MTNSEKKAILEASKHWFYQDIAQQHIENTKKLSDISNFNINPFLAIYLANFLTGNSKPESIAKALIYPRVLGTSITTSFGTNIQKFTSIVLPSFGSTTPGIDIEFVDCLDHTKKYCQLKAGPNTINKDDVESIAGHFKSTINLSKTNNLRISFSDLIVGVIYGTESELSGHYKRITSQYHYPVIVGQDFWLRLTGDKDFYFDLIKAISDIAIGTDFSKELDTVIHELATSQKIQELAKKV